jgi:hypothetical protein
MCVCVCVDLDFDVDFGGQDEYRVTHQLFLGGSRALFMLVVPMDKEVSRASIESWMRCIVSRSPSASIVLVASKMDVYSAMLHANEEPVLRRKGPSGGPPPERVCSMLTYAREALEKIIEQQRRRAQRLLESVDSGDMSDMGEQQKRLAMMMTNIDVRLPANESEVRDKLYAAHAGSLCISRLFFFVLLCMCIVSYAFLVSLHLSLAPQYVRERA